jgi:hypothetical protein
MEHVNSSNVRAVIHKCSLSGYDVVPVKPFSSNKSTRMVTLSFARYTVLVIMYNLRRGLSSRLSGLASRSFGDHFTTLVCGERYITMYYNLVLLIREVAYPINILAMKPGPVGSFPLVHTPCNLVQTRSMCRAYCTFT